MRLRLRAGLVVVSLVALVAGIAWAFDAQIVVMGGGQAPVVTGSVTPTQGGDTLDAEVTATGVRSSNRIVVSAFESSDHNGDIDSTKIPLYFSKTGPDPDGRVNVHVVAQIPGADLQQYPYLFVTAVLGEDQRDCDGALVEGHGPAAPDATACLTLERPGAPTSASGPGSATPSAAALSTPTVVEVPGTVSWTTTGVFLAKGERFVVRATGQVGYIQGAPPVGPDGDTQPHPNVCVLPGPDHHAGLIGRIAGAATGPPFLIGSSFDGSADQSGQLVLGINDVGVENNRGAFQAAVQVPKS